MYTRKIETPLAIRRLIPVLAGARVSLQSDNRERDPMCVIRTWNEISIRFHSVLCNRKAVVIPCKAKEESGCEELSDLLDIIICAMYARFTPLQCDIGEACVAFAWISNCTRVVAARIKRSHSIELPGKFNYFKERSCISVITNEWT